MNLHWLEQIKLGYKKAPKDFLNKPRISAEDILKLIQWKNEMLGIKRSLHEESVIAEERDINVV